MTARKTTTIVITHPSQVPAGYVRMSELAHTENEERALSDAHTRGRLPACKLMLSPVHRTGPVWVDPDAAMEVLFRHRAQAAAAPAAAAAPPVQPQSAPAPPTNTRVLERIAVALERLAAVAEESWVSRESGREVVS